MEDTTADTYVIKNNILTLNSDEEYIIKGTCSECGIEVKKGTSPEITLSSVTIDNSATGPFIMKKSTNVNLILEGISTITDNESDESSSDFEGAGIKFKSGSNLTISGTGTLIVIGKIKNGIKGASGSNLIINSGIINVTCVNNGIASDGSVTINGGTFNVETSEGDGIKSDPDYGDTESERSVTINGGTFNINSFSDGIQAKAQLTINGGVFNIKTFKTGSSANFDKDLYSAKGLKVSTNETSEISMVITGGTFNLNTADDSVHSDGNITITGGTFQISSGDDGVHADQYLMLGKNGDSNDLVKINITKSYEGLEGAQVYIYSGIYRVIASDDGINAAGDTTDQCRQGNMPGGNNNFGPRRNLRGKQRKLQQIQCNTFHIYISGGDIYVNAGADGLDANGNIVISGGNLEIWGARTGSDGDFIDLDGSMSITDGTLFGGGNAGMTNPTSWKNSQNKIYGSNSVSANSVVNIMSGTTTIKSYTTPKNVGYLYYTSPDVDSNYKFSIDGSSGNNNGNDGQQGFPGNNGNMPGNNGQFPNNNGTMPGPGNNGQFPNNNGTMPQFPGNNDQFPNNNGTMPQFPGNNGQFPGNNGTMPGDNGQFPGENGQFPGNNGQFPGNNGTMPGPDNNGQFPGQENNGTMPGFPGNSEPFPENNGTMPQGPPEGEQGNNGTMPMPPNQENDSTNQRQEDTEDDDDELFEQFLNGGIFMKFNLCYLIMIAAFAF